MKEPWFNDNWYVSKANYWDEVVEKFQLPEKVIFHDATLRDGEQMPGVVFLPEDKVRIAKMLDKLGVQRIEAGMPAVSSQDFQAVKDIVNLKLNSKIMAFSRTMESDIEKAIDCGVWGTVIEITCGEFRLKYQHPQWTIDDVVKKSVDTINYAKKQGLYVVYFPYDTTRSDPAFLKELLKQVTEKSDPDAVAVVDTTGTIIPPAMKQLILNVKEATGGRPVEVHTHNDLNLGVANALAAMEAGAEVIHGCINGLGERCGNIAIEEIAVAVSALYGIETGIKTEYIMEACKLVEELSGVKLAFNKSLVGQAAYMKESGVGIEVAKNYPFVTFPISPAYVGAKQLLVVGKKSGKNSIKVKLEDLGLELSDDIIEKLLDIVKAKSIEMRRYLTDDEFKGIVERVLEKEGKK
ncbi:MAG: 2-isopropylmalate synthase [Firmicutes bacterium]|nr:2-isopropylmalate synthase [Bacillota bacterium]